MNPVRMSGLALVPATLATLGLATAAFARQEASPAPEPKPTPPEAAASAGASSEVVEMVRAVAPGDLTDDVARLEKAANAIVEMVKSLLPMAGTDRIPSLSIHVGDIFLVGFDEAIDVEEWGMVESNVDNAAGADVAAGVDPAAPPAASAEPKDPLAKSPIGKIVGVVSGEPGPGGIKIHVGDVFLVGFDEAIDAEEWGMTERNVQLAASVASGTAPALPAVAPNEPQPPSRKTMLVRKGNLMMLAVKESIEPVPAKKADAPAAP